MKNFIKSLAIALLFTAAPAEAFKVGGMNWVTTDGTAGQVMKTDGAANLGWVTVLTPTSISGTAPITYNSGTGAIGIPLATNSVNGYLSSADRTDFNNRITGLSSDVSATGPSGSTGPSVVAATVNSVGGSSASLVHAAELLANAATSSNTASAIVKRGSSGEFTATTITATTFIGALTGTASGNTTYTPNQYGVVVSGSANAMSIVTPDASTTKVLKSGGASANPSWLAYDNSNTVSTLVFRDGSGNFSAGTITASITGHASLDATAASPTFTGTFTGPWTTAGPLITSSSGVVTSEAQLSAARGGTAGDSSGSTGIAHVSSGTWSYSTIVNADVNASAAIAYTKLALTGSILNADINASAAIAYSKLNLATSIVNADVNASAAIAYSKLNLATSIVNADVNASAAIAYTKLALTGSILNADINASAAIAYSKLALTGAILNADLAGSIAYSKLSLTGAILNADLAGSIADTKLSTIATAGKVSDSALPSSMATKTFTGVTSFPGTSSIDGSGNAIFGGNARSLTSSVGAALVTNTQSSWTSPTTVTGTLSNSASGTAVTGVGTFFETEFLVGQTLTMNGETRTIASITSDTALVTDAWTGANSGVTATKAAVPGPYVYPNGNIQIGGDRTELAAALVSSNNRLLIIGTAPAVGSTSIGAPIVRIINYTGAASSTTGPVNFDIGRARGTEAIPSAVLSADSLGVLANASYDGTAFAVASRITTFATENWSATAHGTKMTLGITPNTTTTNTTVITIGQDSSTQFAGVVQINRTAVLNFTSEQLTSNNSSDCSAQSCAGANIQLRESNGTSANNSNNVALHVEHRRVTTADPSDSASQYGLEIQNTYSPATATTYTNTGSDGIVALLIPAISNGGAGTLAISKYEAIEIKADSTAGITYKTSILLGAPTGATNNASIADNVAYSGTYFINQSGTTASVLAGPVTMSNAAIKMTGITTGTNADTVCLKSDGTLLIQAAACTISSRRFKENIVSLDNTSGLAEVLQLRPVQFNMIDDGSSRDHVNFSHTQTGLIAEEVEAIDSRLAIYEADGVTPKSYRQEAVISILIKAIQEQQEQIEALKAAVGE